MSLWKEIKNMLKGTPQKLIGKLEEKLKEISENREQRENYLENEKQSKRYGRPFHKVNIHLLGSSLER